MLRVTSTRYQIFLSGAGVFDEIIFANSQIMPGCIFRDRRNTPHRGISSGDAL